MSPSAAMGRLPLQRRLLHSVLLARPSISSMDQLGTFKLSSLRAAPRPHGGRSSTQQPVITAGGGPRTFPGGVTKWQWKRMQEKKARQLERAQLMREREVFEAQRREQMRLISGPERPWEEGVKPPPAVQRLATPQAPKDVVERFHKVEEAEDLWNERDGPTVFRRSNGEVSARLLPASARFSTAAYRRETLVAGEAGPNQQIITRRIHTTQREDVGQRGIGGGMEEGRRSGGELAKRNDGSGVKPGNGKDLSFITDVRFDSFPLSPYSIRALHEDMGYELCTIVQAATMPPILAGRDVLAKAKTGTGKTIAFLLPALEAMLKADAQQPSRNSSIAGTPIRVLVICPARELAAQVAEESKQLLQHHRGCGAMLVIGGTRMPGEAARLAKQPCQVLVGTPGRLLDHIQTTPGVKQQLQGLQVLIMDECDQLLDMGFRKTLDGILAALPKKRQTLLFSATLPAEVKNMADVALRRDHDFIDTVGAETTETNTQVRQESLVVAMEQQLPMLYSILQQHMAEEPQYKVLVFATTARQTQLMAELFSLLGVNALEIHSRKSQAYRTRVSDEFRKSPGKVVMCTSDVSARGVDYPDVTLVLQVGVPSERAQYVHRLGRTGRAGKEGRGVLLLAPSEQFFLRQLSDLPVSAMSPPPIDPKLQAKVTAALQKVDRLTKEKAYQSWLGYYNGIKGTGWDKPTLVQMGNFYSTTLGLPEPPALMRKTVGMMGLKGVPGLRVM